MEKIGNRPVLRHTSNSSKHTHPLLLNTSFLFMRRLQHRSGSLVESGSWARVWCLWSCHLQQRYSSGWDFVLTSICSFTWRCRVACDRDERQGTKLFLLLQRCALLVKIQSNPNYPLSFKQNWQNNKDIIWYMISPNFPRIFPHKKIPDTVVHILEILLTPLGSSLRRNIGWRKLVNTYQGHTIMNIISFSHPSVPDSLSDTWVFVSNEETPSVHYENVCGYIENGEHNVVFVPCNYNHVDPPLRGRYVMLQRDNRARSKTMMHFCEVVVFSCHPGFWGINMTGAEDCSRTYENCVDLSCKVADGSCYFGCKDGTCTTGKLTCY